MKHQVIHQLTAEKVVTVQQGCQMLGVSRSGFYAGRRRSRQPKTLCGMRVRLRSLFEATGQCYGSRRLRKELAEQGTCRSHYFYPQFLCMQSIRLLNQSTKLGNTIKTIKTSGPFLSLKFGFPMEAFPATCLCIFLTHFCRNIRHLPLT